MRISSSQRPVFLSLTLVSVALTSRLYAQDSKPLSASERLEGLRTHLGLSQEQFAEIKPLLEEEATKLKILKEDATLSDLEKRAKAREVSSEIRDKIGVMLTPEQREKAVDFMRSRAASTSSTGARNEAAQRLAAMKATLGLTDEQMEKLKPILRKKVPK